jgi:hypothetical protein
VVTKLYLSKEICSSRSRSRYTHALTGLRAGNWAGMLRRRIVMRKHKPALTFARATAVMAERAGIPLATIYAVMHQMDAEHPRGEPGEPG